VRKTQAGVGRGGGKGTAPTIAPGKGLYKYIVPQAMSLVLCHVCVGKAAKSEGGKSAPTAPKWTKQDDQAQKIQRAYRGYRYICSGLKGLIHAAKHRGLIGVIGICSGLKGVTEGLEGL
jgi:hypothetical protein